MRRLSKLTWFLREWSGNSGSAKTRSLKVFSASKSEPAKPFYLCSSHFRAFELLVMSSPFFDVYSFWLEDQLLTYFHF